MLEGEKAVRGTHVYVVSTGRCGNASLHKWLNERGVSAAIEPHAGGLVVQGRCRLSGERYSNVALMQTLAVPESVIVDNSTSMFIDWFAENGALSRFVWLIRNPWDCISSLMAWKWYRKPKDIEPDDVFANHRLAADVAGEMTADEWKGLSLLGRCAWHWKFLNLRIERQLAALDEDCWIRVRLEDWSPAIAGSLLRFAGSVDMDVTDWPLPKMNAGPQGRDRPRWTEDEVALVTEIAGKTLARWYPERNFQMPRAGASG